MGRVEGEAHEEYWCLTHAFDFLLQQQPGLKLPCNVTLSGGPIAARAFATEVNTCVERVGEAPNRWPRYLRGTRRYFFRTFLSALSTGFVTGKSR